MDRFSRRYFCNDKYQYWVQGENAEKQYKITFEGPFNIIIDNSEEEQGWDLPILNEYQTAKNPELWV